MQFKVHYDILNVISDGRKVEVNITDQNTGEVFSGKAECHPADGFDMKKGYDIALRRAIANLVSTDLQWDNMVDGMTSTQRRKLGYSKIYKRLG